MSLCQLVCSTSSERLLEFWSQILLTVSASGFLVLVSDSSLVLGSVESRSLSSWVRWSTDFFATLWRAVAFLVVAARAVWRFWLVFSEKSVRVCSTYNCKKILSFEKWFYVFRCVPEFLITWQNFFWSPLFERLFGGIFIYASIFNFMVYDNFLDI